MSPKRLPLAAVAVVAAGVLGSLALRSPSAVVPTHLSSGATTSVGGAGIQVSGVQAFLWPDGAVIDLVAIVTNNTAGNVGFIGGSSPVAGHAALYATTDCWLPTAAPHPDLCGKNEMPFWLVESHSSIQLRYGDGEMLLTDLRQPVAPGQTIQVTFDFKDSPSVAADVVVASFEDREQD